MTKIKTDSNGKPPEFYPGDRVFVGPVQMEAIVIRQVLHYDMNMQNCEGDLGFAIFKTKNHFGVEQ